MSIHAQPAKIDSGANLRICIWPTTRWQSGFPARPESSNAHARTALTCNSAVVPTRAVRGASCSLIDRPSDKTERILPVGWELTAVAVVPVAGWR